MPTPDDRSKNIQGQGYSPDQPMRESSSARGSTRMEEGDSGVVGRSGRELKSPEQLRREADEVEQEGVGLEEGKNPHRVAGGKRAQATRKEEGNQS